MKHSQHILSPAFHACITYRAICCTCIALAHLIIYYCGNLKDHFELLFLSLLVYRLVAFILLQFHHVREHTYLIIALSP